jgi:hypothetical protein
VQRSIAFALDITISLAPIYFWPGAFFIVPGY